MTVWNNVASLLTSEDLLGPLAAALLCVIVVINLICIAVALSSLRNLRNLVFVFFGLFAVFLVTFYGVSEYCASRPRTMWDSFAWSPMDPLPDYLCAANEFRIGAVGGLMRCVELLMMAMK